MPAASAEASVHEPERAFAPEAAAASQSEGRVSVARTVPESAVAQVAGAAPVRIRISAEVLIVVSMLSRRALRTATES